MFFFVNEDNVCVNIFCHFIPKEAQGVTLPNPSLADDDNDGVLTKILRNLVKITMPNYCLHSFCR